MASLKPIDLLSQMQCELHRLSELFFSTIGELQQNALPASVNEEELVRPSSTSYDAGARSKGFSEELGQVNHHIPYGRALSLYCDQFITTSTRYGAWGRPYLIVFPIAYTHHGIHG